MDDHLVANVFLLNVLSFFTHQFDFLRLPQVGRNEINIPRVHMTERLCLGTNAFTCLIDHCPLGCSWQRSIPTFNGFTLRMKFFRHDPTIRVPNQTQIFVFILHGSSFKDEMGKTTSHFEDLRVEESNNVKQSGNLSLCFYVFSPLSL